MSDNPFEAGDSPQPFDDRAVDIGAALAGGSRLAVRHALQFLLSSGLLFVAYIVSICTCVGIFAAAPFLIWGLYAFLLTVGDDAPRIDAVWSGLEQPGRTFLSGWGMIFCLMIVLSPTMGASFAATIAAEQGLLPASAASWLPTLVGVVWGALIAPLTYAPLLWADERASVLSSFTMAIDAFKASWLSLAALSVITQVLMLPATAVGVWMQESQLEMISASPEELTSMLGAMGGAMVALYAWLFLAGVLSQSWMVHAYRQVVPRAAVDPIPDVAQ